MRSSLALEVSEVSTRSLSSLRREEAKIFGISTTVLDFSTMGSCCCNEPELFLLGKLNVDRSIWANAAYFRR